MGNIFIFVFIGGVACGAIVIFLIACLRWKALSLRLQPPEHCMWETAPSTGMSRDGLALLNKMKTETLGEKKKKD
ncbi:hypothetical protein LSCM1_07789 [Leishmania martiniquensis]|uniref:Uncharacterized protein n=1 Tax=Leishmania martiniquensis TaxID=1580590 RepID=A0A836KVD3_9TRYP|nr:hypothetical protein LSCM1_07789 [Leishmania martiniquensis]